MDGGVSSNDFVMQLTSDLFGRKVARPQHYEMSCLGAAYVAGLEVGRQTHTNTHTKHVYYAVLSSDSCFCIVIIFQICSDTEHSSLES